MMNNTRLRKTFQYPTDDSDEDDAPQAMDEEGARPYHLDHFRI